MPTRNVVLTNHHEEIIETLVASGRYQNASEILREGLRLVEQREAEDAAKLHALRQAAQTGIDSLESGEFKSFSSIEELQDHLRRASDPVIGALPQE